MSRTGARRGTVRRTQQRGADLVEKQAGRVLALEAEGAFIVVEQAFFGQKRGRMVLTATVPLGDAVLLVEHLVIDDPRDVIGGHVLAIERRMDANQPIFDRVRTHRQGLVEFWSAAVSFAASPGDSGTDGTAKVGRVYFVENRLQIVKNPARSGHDAARTTGRVAWHRNRMPRDERIQGF